MKKLKNHILIVCGLLIFGIAFLTLTANAASTILPWLSGNSPSVSPSGDSSNSFNSENHELDSTETSSLFGSMGDARQLFVSPITDSANAVSGPDSSTGIGGQNSNHDAESNFSDTDIGAVASPIHSIQPASEDSDEPSGSNPTSSGTSSDALDSSGSDTGDSGSSSQPPADSSESDPDSASSGSTSSDTSDSESSSHHHHHRSVSITGVTLNQSNLELVKGDSAVLTATVTPSNTTQSKTIAWSSSDQSIATVDSSGKITAVEGGTATVTAKSSNGKTAVCDVTVTVPVTGVSLDKTELSLVKSTTSAALIATVTPKDASDQTVSWSSSDESIATVDSSGKVTAVEGGIATITATTPNGKTAACTVTVSVPAAGITLSLSDVPVERGNTIALIATLDPPDSTDKILWATSDSSIASVDDSGNITGVSPGNATITASVGDRSISASCQITTVVSISELDLSDTELSLKKGDEHRLSAQVLPEDTTEDKTVIWSSSDESVVTVDSSGNVTAIEGGTAIITAQTGSHSAQCTVTVTVPVTGITFDQDSYTIARGTTETLSPVITPDDATDKAVTWGSLDQSIATVDRFGNVTAVSVGTTTLTAITHDGGFAAQCKITVVVPVTGISLNKTDLGLIKGDNAALTATITPDDATNNTVTWSSSDETVAIVDSSGQVTAVEGGTATITATSADGGFTASCTVTVTVPVTGIALNQTKLTLVRGTTGTLTPIFTPDDATDKAALWSSSDSSIATVDGSGKITAVSAGTATITATAHDGGFTAQCTVTVVVPVTAIRLDKANLSLIKGHTDTLTANITPTDATNKAVTWSTSNDSVVTVDSAGKIKAVGGGTATVTVTTDDGGYTASCNVTVTVPVTGIALAKNTLSLAKSDTDSLTAIFTPADATDKAVTWRSSNESVVTVDNLGNVKAQSEGTAIITATSHDGGFTTQCTVTVGHTWKISLDTTEINGSRTSISCSSLYASEAYFSGDEGIGTSHAVYTFDTPILMKSGSTLKALESSIWDPETNIFINGESIGRTSKYANYNGKDDHCYGFNYQFSNDTYVSTIEITSEKSEHGTWDHTPHSYTALWVTPKGEKSFLLNSSKTSSGQDCSDWYYLYTEEKSKDKHTYVSFYSSYIKFREDTGRDLYVQFTNPQSIDHIEVTTDSSYRTDVNMEAEDFSGNSYYNDGTIRTSNDSLNFSANSSRCNWNALADLTINCNNNREDVRAYITIYYTDGTSKRIGTSTSHGTIG